MGKKVPRECGFFESILLQQEAYAKVYVYIKIPIKCNKKEKIYIK
jgi:hypothetical protein